MLPNNLFTRMLVKSDRGWILKGTIWVSWVNHPSLEEQDPSLEISEEEEERMICIEVVLPGFATAFPHLNIRNSSGGCPFLVNFDHCFLGHLGLNSMKIIP